MDDLFSIHEYRIFKTVEITIRRGLGRMEKNRRDEPIQVIIHINTEMSQANSPYSCLKQTKTYFFFFTKSENKRAEQVLSWYK
jgi:hypothetical protein